MAGISGQGTTFNLPNFTGELFSISPEDTPLLTAIGGLTGGLRADAKRFEWEFYDLRTPADRATRLEGANAPTPEERVRALGTNVLQIVHEAVEVSYTKTAATAQGESTTLVNSGGNPVTNEQDWQVEVALKQIARDIEWSFINGQFAEPADNSTPRKTRGLLQAITTNAIALAANAVGGDQTGVAATDLITAASAHGLVVGDLVKFTTLNGGTGLVVSTAYYVVNVPSTTTYQLGATRGGAVIDFTTAITTGTVLALFPKISNESIGNAMQSAFDNGGLQEGETRTAIVGPLQKRRLTKALITDVLYQETSRNVGGASVQVIETDFGPLNIMLDRFMPADTIVFVSLEDLAPMMLEVPGKGFLFVEPLAKVGSAERSQIYGEIGLKYGNQAKHAKITGLG